MNVCRWLVPLLTTSVLACPAWAGWGVSVGIGCRPYGYYRPYYGYGPYYPPVVVGVGGPVVYPPPTVVQPVVVQPGYAVAPPPGQPVPPPPPGQAGPPPPQAQSVPLPPPDAQAALPLAPVPTYSPTSRAEIDRCVAHLANPDEKARAEAVVQLGRLRAAQAVDQMTLVLTSDRSPTVREAAARGLGLIGSSAALPALQQAAQSDEDHEVRNSARFAVDVIRSRNP